VWPAGVEPAAPRVSSGRSTGLSYGHLGVVPTASRPSPPRPTWRAWPMTIRTITGARAEGTRLPRAAKRSGARESRRSWSRTSGLLRIRQALSRLSYPPVRLRDKGSNLDLHVQRVVVSCRLDDPGSLKTSLRPHPARRESTQQQILSHLSQPACVPNDVFYATRLPFDPGSARRRPTWRGFGARVSTLFRKICRLKHTQTFERVLRAAAPRSLSLSSGASNRSSSCSS
jgi:hypothetical protein